MTKNAPTNPQPPSQPQPAPQAPAVQGRVTATQFIGPLPPPNILAGYNAIVPGAADRIIRMAEDDFRHLHEMEQRSINGAFAERRLGQIFGLCIGTVALLVTAFLGYTGHDVAASLVGGTTLVGLVAIFVIGKIYPSNK